MASPTEAQSYDIPDFKFQDGTRLSNVRLVYRDINPSATKIALLPTCFRGRVGTTLTFADGALKNYRVIVVAIFGNGESASPSNTKGFPQSIDYRDCVRAQHILLTEHLRIKAVDAVIGFSMGGQTAYYWAAMFPDFVRDVVVICSSARTSRHNYQFLEGPKAALENAADYSAEDSASQGQRGLNAFGKAYSAWLTSHEWFEQELYKELGFETLQEWDKATTDTNYQGWYANDMLAKLRMWQNGDISVCTEAGSLEEALRRIKNRILLLPCQTDQYFSWRASARESQYLEFAELDIIPSVWGHIAGGGTNKRDTEWMDKRISKFLVHPS